MKCSRCGEECKDNQVFCLKCGTLIQVVPDFNLIEAELANNVGELMKEDKKVKDEEEDMTYLDDEHYTTDSLTKTNTDIELVDIMNYDDNMDINSFDVDSSDFSNERKTKQKANISQKKDVELQKEKKMFKIKAVIFSFVGVIVIMIAVILFSQLDKKDNSKDSFKDICNKGYDYYVAKDYEKALDEFLGAKNIADSKEENIKVNKYILSCYEEMENVDAETIDILKQLIELDHSKAEYYEKIVKIYEKNDMNEEITKLIDSIEDDSIKAMLAEYTVSAPKASYEAGKYDEAISIKLTSGVKTKIYYTLDGTDPTVESTEYTDEIKLSSNGETTVKSIAVNESGLVSKISEYKYEIELSVLDGPEVSPTDNKEYSAPTEITVNVPEGMKCYYTYGESAKVPSTSDKEYTEPVKMKRGKNYFVAILVSEDGVESKPTQKFYSLNRVYDYEGALNVLQGYFVNNGIANKVSDTEFIKGTTTITLSYDSIGFVENAEFWVIKAVETDSSGNIINTIYYGIDTVSGLTDGKPAILVQDPENADKYIITE